MKKIIYALMICGVSALQSTAKTPWNLILIDHSADMFAADKSGISDMTVTDAAMLPIYPKMVKGDSIMIFADNTRMVSASNYCTMDYGKRIAMGNAYGIPTSIYDAVCESLNHLEGPGRVLVVTNGFDTSSSFSPRTMAKIVSDRGVRVDGILVTNGADSVRNRNRTEYDPKAGNPEGFRTFITSNGGILTEVNPKSDFYPVIDRMIDQIAKSDDSPRPKSDLDQHLTDSVVRSITLTDIIPFTTDTATNLRYMDMVFHGIDDLLEKGKRNKFIYIDAIPYDCEDDETGTVTEETVYHIMIADSQVDFAKKRNLFKKRTPEINDPADYNQLDGKTPYEMLPMIRYDTQDDFMTVCGLETF